MVKDSDVKKLIKAIADAAITGEIGDSKIFVHPVDDALRVRTGDKGEDAIY